jgi:hypothetical protein
MPTTYDPVTELPDHAAPFQTATAGSIPCLKAFSSPVDPAARQYEALRQVAPCRKSPTGFTNPETVDDLHDVPSHVSTRADFASPAVLVRDPTAKHSEVPAHVTPER